MRILLLNSVALACVALMLTPAIAAEPYEGAWVKSVKECSSKNDGPTSLTVIDLKVNVDGKALPMVEQYENHCFIDKKSTTGKDTTLTLASDAKIYKADDAKKSPTGTFADLTVGTRIKAHTTGDEGALTATEVHIQAPKGDKNPAPPTPPAATPAPATP